MAYWGDVLDSEDKLNGDFKHEEPHKADPVKLLTFKIKAGGKNSSLSQGFDMVYNSDRSGHNFKSKSEFKHSCMDDQLSNKITVTNKDKAWEMAYSPNSLNKDGVVTEFAHEGKFAPAASGKGAYESFVSAQTGGFKLGPITPYLRAQLNINNKKERTFEQHGNFVYEKDWNLGYKLNFDVVAKSFTSAFGLLALKNQEWGAAWLRCNCSQRFVALGWAGNAWGFKNVLEAQYNYGPKENVKVNGIAGVPFYLRFSGSKNLNLGTASFTTIIGEGVDCAGKITTKVQDNASVTIQERLNFDQWIKGNASDVKYQWGIGVELKV